jgi:hypothetical protein
MGDYLNNGNKIGTCGQGYYTTLEALKEFRSESEAAYYLKPQNGCSFAFPFPEYDGKRAGEISNFHEGDRVDFLVSLPADKFNTFHNKISNHINVAGTQINVFSPCVYDGADTSTNFDKSRVKMYLKEQKYFNGSLHVVCTCACCGTSNILDLEEAVYIAKDLQQKSERLNTQSKLSGVSPEEAEKKMNESLYLMQIANRILSTYEQQK